MGKLSISLDDELEAELRRAVGTAKVSPFVAEAVRNELRRRRLGTFLDELDGELGPVPGEVMAEAAAAFARVEAAASGAEPQRSRRRAG